MRKLFQKFKSERISIVYKLIFIITVLISGGMFSLGLIVLNNQSSVLTEQMEVLGNTLASQVAESSGELILANDQVGLEMVINNTLKHAVVSGVTLYNNKKQILAHNGHQRTLEQADISPLPIQRNINKSPDDLGLFSVVKAIVYQNITVGYIQINFDRSRLDESRQKSLEDIIWSTLLMVLVGFSVAFLIGKWLTSPIFEVISASKQIGDGQFNVRIGFKRNDEIGELAESLTNMAAGLKRKDQVENALHKYISPNIANEVLNHLDQIELGGEPIEAVVMFTDIIGFTKLSEGMSPKDITELLNDYFSVTAQAAHLHKGHIDKFIGDCAMVVFGIPASKEHHSYNAISAALLMVELFEQLSTIRRKEGKKSVQFRFGINSGKMVAGNLGAPERMEYTVIGETVNLASRLSHVGKANEVIVTGDMLEKDGLIGRLGCHFYEKIIIRGVEEPVSTFNITGLTEKTDKEIKEMASKILADRV